MAEQSRVLQLVRDGALAFEIPGYRILRELGHGGMATVYLAEQTSLKREVALKVLEPARAADPAFNERFLREGRIAANLHHRHIVAIHDLGVHGGRPYLAMDYLPLGSIAELAGQFTPAEALRCVREIASALDLAHRHGIIHRDVKPENILRHEDGSFLLGDFGIARDLNASTMTVEGSALGTPSYMSPEQWRNERVDGRADLYSLGIVLYQLLTGRVPYAGTDGWSIGMQHMGAPVPLLPASCLVLQPLLQGLLAKKANERYASGADVAAAITELERSGQVPADSGAGADTSAAPPWSLTQLAKLFEQPRAPAPARWPYAAFAGVLLLALLVFGWRSRTSSPPPTEPPKAGATVAGTLAGSALVAGGGLGAIAVLPCVGQVADERFAHYGDGLAEELIHRLGRLKSLPVIGRTSSFAFKDSALTAGAIGQELGAEHVLACTVRETGDGLRIGAELIVSASDTQRWSGVYETAADAALTAVDQIAVRIAETLLASLVGSERALLARHSTRNPQALELFWQSLVASNEWQADSGMRARKLAEQAVALDPGFALAHVALAHAWINDQQMSMLKPEIARTPIETALDTALAIDPDLAEAHALRGTKSGMLDWDWAAQRRHLERALLLQPNSVLANQFMADSLWMLGPRADAIEYTRRARDLDPRNPHLWAYHVAANFHAFRYEEADRQAALTIERFPDVWVAYWMRAWSLQFRGRCQEALADAKQAVAMLEHPDTLGPLASIQACANRPADAEGVLARFAQMRASGIEVPWTMDAIVLAALGRIDEAHTAAGNAIAQRDWRLPGFLVSQWWEPLHADPRFPELMRRTQLPEQALRAYREARAWREQLDAQSPTKESDDV